MSDSDLDKYGEINTLLTEIKSKGNLDGVIFARRNGELINENIGDEFNSKKFASMCATVLESALGIGETLSNQKVKKIITELEEKTILIIECDNSTFFTLIITPDSKISYIMSKLEEIIQKFIKM